MKESPKPKLEQGSQVRISKEGHEHHGKAGELVGFFQGEEDVRVPNPKADPSHREYDPQQPKMIWAKRPFVRHAVRLDGVEKPVAFDEEHLEPKAESRAPQVLSAEDADEPRKGKRKA